MCSLEFVRKELHLSEQLGLKEGSAAECAEGFCKKGSTAECADLQLSVQFWVIEKICS